MRFRVLFLALALSFMAGPVFLAEPAGAEIPRATQERAAQIQVEMAELSHLSDIGKLTFQEYSRRLAALQNGLDAIFAPYPLDEVMSARSAINGLAGARLSLLRPQWAKEAQALREASQEREKQLAAALEEDARSAVEFQRRRLILQGQLGRGEIGSDEFSRGDSEALAGITNLRKKYEAVNGTWATRFDQRLDLFTKALADNPDTALPKSQVAAAEKTGAPDFNSDAKLAADILIKQEENQFKFEKKQVSPDTFRETDVIYRNDIARLRTRYQEISPQRGQEFENAYTQLAAPQIQNLRAQYYPDKYAPVVSANSGGGVSAPSGPAQNKTSFGFGWIIGGALVVLFFWWAFTRKKAPADPAPPLSDNFGTAEWAALQQLPLSPTTIHRGVTFGKSSHPQVPPDAPGAPITSFPEAHTLIVARTRAGKGTRVIVPTLLRYGGSMLVIDPKGENAAITARTRRDQLHQTVHIVNPWGEMADLYKRLGFSSATFNPLDAIDRNDPNAVAVAQTLAATICPATEGKDKFWQGSAANVLTGVFLWIADDPGEQKTLARAREIITMSRADFKKILVRMMTSTAYHGAIKEMVSQYIDLADETYSGIMANLAENTKFLSDPRIKAATATSSLSMKTLRDEFMTIYLVIPHDRIQTHATWLRLVIASAMQALKSRNALANAPHHRCMFLIDEFGSIGRIDDIPRDIALMSGYGLDFTLIVQGLDQLKHHYGEARGTILSNCGFKWFCQVNELETAKYLSESLGKATVRTVGRSESVGSNPGGGTTGESTTYGEVGRSLLTPDEILNLGRDVAILLNPYGSPYYLRPVDYWKLPEVFAHLKDGYIHFYWDPPLQYDDNPYFNQKPPPPPPKSGMSEKEARDILGVAADARADAIRAAYKRLMLKVHPDTGGSNYLARQINAARAVLLGE